MRVPLSLFVAFCLLPTVAQAQFYKAQRCDTCTTSEQFRGRAIAAGQGHHLVFNLLTNQIEYWHVPADAGGPPGTPRASVATSQAQARTVPAAATQELDRAHTLHVIGGGTLRPIINVPISELNVNPSVRAKSAYEFVSDYNMQAMIESAAGDAGVVSRVTGENLISALSDLMSLATSYLGLKDQSALIFRVVFTDGSYVHVRISLDHPNGEYLLDSARTAGDQLIPRHLDQVNGEWTNYGGDNLGPMAEHMQTMGATMSFVGPSSGTIISIVCSGTGLDKVCRVEKVIY
ncbi:hypothetical protein LDO32_16940 [Luteimonas sp. Y-2-2-4F]|nr:hypothetical protein [Luteimonas sp. Y-2-2-4F]MCD9033403.1 hypothetical protein [Luteimonas sp. Y-2-2-4F]